MFLIGKIVSVILTYPLGFAINVEIIGKVLLQTQFAGFPEYLLYI